jgi:hypothetical protein
MEGDLSLISLAKCPLHELKPVQHFLQDLWQGFIRVGLSRSYEGSRRPVGPVLRVVDVGVKVVVEKSINLVLPFAWADVVEIKTFRAVR